jgi:hypothetical protein
MPTRLGAQQTNVIPGEAWPADVRLLPGEDPRS